MPHPCGCSEHIPCLGLFLKDRDISASTFGLQHTGSDYSYYSSKKVCLFPQRLYRVHIGGCGAGGFSHSPREIPQTVHSALHGGFGRLIHNPLPPLLLSLRNELLVRTAIRQIQEYSDGRSLLHQLPGGSLSPHFDWVIFPNLFLLA